MKSKIMTLNLHARLLALALMLASANSGSAQTWQTVLDYQYPGGTASGGSIAADASGNVFSGGIGNDAAGIARGMVLQTDTTQLANPDPSAINWYFSDDSNPNPSQYESFVWDLGLDAGGNIYSVGQLTPISTGVPSWYVRKSSNKGGTWSTVDLYQYAQGLNTWVNASGFAADNSGNIYVVGSGRDAGTKKIPTATSTGWCARALMEGRPGRWWTT